MIKFKSKYAEGFFDIDNRKIIVENDTYVYPISWQKRPGRLYIIFSTECNLRCSYCFQNGLERADSCVDMNDLYKYINSFRNHITEIVLFGGEPLLNSNYDYIVSVLERFDYLGFIIFTNGNFDEQYRNLIIQYSYCIKSVIITLDGARDMHNRRRINPSKDSYDTIIENLRFLSGKGVILDVQLNIDKENAKSFQVLMGDISSDESLTGLDYTLNPVKYTKFSLDYNELLEIYFSLKENFPYRIFVNNRLVMNLMYLLSGRPLLSNRCALDSTYVLSLPDSTVYSCPQNPSSLVGRIEDGEVRLEKGLLSDKVLITQYKRNKCKNCRYSYLCPYCCPYVPEGEKCRDNVKSLLEKSFIHIDSLVDLRRLSDTGRELK